MRKRENDSGRERGDEARANSGGAFSTARLEELLAFAQVYRGWTQKELAAFLGRDVHNVIPRSGIPKADLLVQLGKALDWAPGAVLEHVCGHTVIDRRTVAEDVEDYSQLNRDAFRAFEDGRFEDLIALGLRMEKLADTPDRRAEACVRQYGGWDGLGRYEQAVEALNRGLREPDVGRPLRLRLQGNLAHSSFVLGRYFESEGAAAAVLDVLGDIGTIEPEYAGTRAMARYARAQSLRCRAILEKDDRSRLAVRACDDFQRAAAEWECHGSAHAVASYGAIAEMCRAGLAGAMAFAARQAPELVIDRCLAAFDSEARVSGPTRGLWNEALGWWCICGAEVAVHLLQDRERIEHLLAIFTNKGHELADRSANWALRERMLTIEYLRRGLHGGASEASGVFVLDAEDIRVLAGTMARFPTFRPYGWSLIRSAAHIK
jgi:hypothetical protein